jgi:hypothetical protein
MGKVFVHHPLKRAELKRLFEPPPPPPPPPVKIEIDPAEIERREIAKAWRIHERAEARRKEEEAIAQRERELGIVMSSFYTLWIEADHFCEWVHKQFKDDKELYQKILDERIDCLLLDMFTPTPDKECVYCRKPAVKHSGQGWAGLMMPAENLVGASESFGLLTYVLCNHCSKLSQKSVMRRAAETSIRLVRKQEKTELIRKGNLQPLDIEYIGDNLEKLVAFNETESLGFVDRLVTVGLMNDPESLNEFT